MKQIIKTKNSPKAIGAYSQAVESGGFLFTSGQIPLDVEGALVPGGIKEQTRQCLNNLKAVLTAAGIGLENVVKTTVYLSDIGNFAKMNEIYAEYFPEDPPARSAVGVAALPRGVLVEIEAISHM